MDRNNPIASLTKDFALRIVKLYKFMTEEKREYVMSKQVLRSGTSIGANVRESIYAQSRADFVSKMSIALKESGETEYWLELLHRNNYLTDIQFNSLYADAEELVKVLTHRCKKLDGVE